MILLYLFDRTEETSFFSSTYPLPTPFLPPCYPLAYNARNDKKH